MAQLPVEMWEEVFSYLPKIKDLKSISLVCKKFSDIVGTIPSLAGRFQLKLYGDQMTRDSMCTIMNSQRKYQKIQFKYFKNSIKMLRISEKFENSLNFLEISDSTLTESTIQENLAACKKIDTLKMSWNSIVKSRKRKRPGEDPEVGPLGVLNQFDESIVEFKSLNAITKLDLEMKSEHSKDLMEVLKNQHHLKELIIYYVGDTTESLFEAQLLEHFKFKLSKFSITCKLESIENIVGFVNSQHESLKHLTIKNSIFSNKRHPYLTDMKQLEYLSYSLDDNERKYLAFPDSLKTLVLDISKFTGGKLLRHKMPNLKSVTLALPNKDDAENSKDSILETINSVSSQCPENSKLTVIVTKHIRFSLQFASPKELSISTRINCQCYNDIIKFSDQFVIGARLKVEDDVMIDILTECEPLKHLEIHNGVGLSGNFGMFLPYIGQNLKVVKIFNYPQFELDSMKQFHKDRPDFRLYTSPHKKVKN
jgi:hypothetical protein